MHFEKKVDIFFEEVNYRMKGIINESSQFGGYVFQDIKKINFFCNEVSMINSTGILNWINWFKLVQDRNSRLEVVFCSCPKVIIDQMNKVKGFLPNGAVVKSFDIPFYCDCCGKNYSKEIALGKEYYEGTISEAGKINLEIMSCPKCNQPMEYDFIPERYFKFLVPLLSLKNA